jgi:hypothetical protein
MKEYKLLDLPPTEEEMNEFAAEGWEIQFVIPRSQWVNYTRILWVRTKQESV